jgi:tetratricopeptide (TPR) repeat protein
MRAALLALLCATAGWGQQRNAVLAQELAHEKTDERIRAYEQRLKASPEDFKLRTGLVSAYLQKLRESADRAYLDRISKLVDRMLEKDGGNATALRFLNEIDLQRHDFKTVAERAQDMAKYTPSDPGVWANLGDASMELGEYQRAGQAYEKMFALRPNLGSYNRLAYFHFVTGDAPGAIALMREAIAAGDPVVENTAWCQAELGDMYFKTGKLSEASEAYRAALSSFPTLHRASAGLGNVEAAQGHIEAAIRNYERAQAIVPLVQYAGALEDLYTAAGMSGKAQEQRDLLKTIETIGRATNEKTNRNLALVLADHTRDLSLALELMQQELPSRGDVYTWDAMSWVLFKSGRLDEAQAATAKALKLGTPEPVFYFHAKRISLASGDEKAAREYDGRLTSLNAKFDFGKTEMASVTAR